MLDAQGVAGDLFATPPGLPDEAIPTCIREEGWIIGGGLAVPARTAALQTAQHPSIIHAGDDSLEHATRTTLPITCRMAIAISA
jgi:hypothetical protein